MTIVTALYDGTDLYLGCNNGATIGDTRLLSAESKWLFFGDWAIGMTGEARQFDLLRGSIDKLLKKAKSPIKIANCMERIFLDRNVMQKDDSDAAASYEVTSILVKKTGEIWDLDTCLALTEIPPNTLWARGCGRDYACGADQALTSFSKDVSCETRVRLATGAAVALDINCPGDVLIEKF